MAFIQETEKNSGGRVYIHCRAGHGRSAAAVFAWLLYKEPDQDPEELNAWLVRRRNVRKTLWKQPNIRKFHSWAIANSNGIRGLGGTDFENQRNIAAERFKLSDSDGETEENTSVDTTSDSDTTREEEEVELLSQYQAV